MDLVFPVRGFILVMSRLWWRTVRLDFKPKTLKPEITGWISVSSCLSSYTDDRLRPETTDIHFCPNQININNPLNIFTLLFTNLESVPWKLTLSSNPTICHPFYWCTNSVCFLINFFQVTLTSCLSVCCLRGRGQTTRYQHT